MQRINKYELVDLLCKTILTHSDCRNNIHEQNTVKSSSPLASINGINISMNRRQFHNNTDELTSIGVEGQLEYGPKSIIPNSLKSNVIAHMKVNQIKPFARHIPNRKFNLTKT
jgi:hypothetical protein